MPEIDRPEAHGRPYTSAEAYADAPRMLAEMNWVIEQTVARPYGTDLGREFRLRKAALLDRIALQESEPCSAKVAAEADAVAEKAAHWFAEYDQERGLGPADGEGWRIPPDSSEWGRSRRPYVRQEYVLWRRLTR